MNFPIGYGLYIVGALFVLTCQSFFQVSKATSGITLLIVVALPAIKIGWDSACLRLQTRKEQKKMKMLEAKTKMLEAKYPGERVLFLRNGDIFLTDRATGTGRTVQQ